MTATQGAEYLHALETRSACKRYDPNSHISKSDFNTILEAARLSPSSFGFEPWKLLVIENQELLDLILECSWGAKQNADRTVVILARRNVTADSDWAHHITHDVQHLSMMTERERLKQFEAFQANDIRVTDDERALFDWSCKQTYIALANMLSAAAMLGVDATPIEGFNARELEELLTFYKLYDPSDWGVSVLVQFGVRDPGQKAANKTRRPFNEVVEYVH